MKLKGKTAIVTGASRGFGAGIAEMLVRAGVKVWITGRSKSQLDSVANKIGAKGIVANVLSDHDWENVMDQVMNDSEKIDILVNNAGVGGSISTIENQSHLEIKRCIETNLTGTILGCQKASGIMIRQKSGLIINIGSVCAKHAWPQWSVYSAAKAGLLQFSRCLFTELKPHGIHVTSVIPSWGKTEFNINAGVTPHNIETENQCIKPLELGKIITQIAELPSHLVTEEVTVWPMVQPICQL